GDVRVPSARRSYHRLVPEGQRSSSLWLAARRRSHQRQSRAGRSGLWQRPDHSLRFSSAVSRSIAGDLSVVLQRDHKQVKHEEYGSGWVDLMSWGNPPATAGGTDFMPLTPRASGGLTRSSIL